MMVDVWELPGPRSFVRAVVDRILSGSSVVLLWPEVAPREFAEALRSEHLHGRVVHIVDGNAEDMPIDAVYRATLGEVPADGARTPKSLANDARLHGLVVHFPRIEGSTAAEWMRFLGEYADAARAVAPGDRIVFVVALRGTQTRGAPRKDVTLDVIKWDDWANEGDAHILASSVLRNRTTTPRRRAFIAASVSRLAIWDLDLVKELCDAGDAEIANPRHALKKWAEGRGWDLSSGSNWEQGTLHTVDGAAMTHSAFLALSDPDALDRRIWSAQAGVFLPWIEERRIQLLPRLSGHIRFPLETDTGRVDRLQDLGIGQIAWAIRSSRLDPSTKQTINRLREARNRLAHLQPLSPELALHEDLIG